MSTYDEKDKDLESPVQHIDTLPASESYVAPAIVDETQAATTGTVNLVGGKKSVVLIPAPSADPRGTCIP